MSNSTGQQAYDLKSLTYTPSHNYKDTPPYINNVLQWCVHTLVGMTADPFPNFQALPKRFVKAAQAFVRHHCMSYDKIKVVCATTKEENLNNYDLFMFIIRNVVLKNGHISKYYALKPSTPDYWPQHDEDYLKEIMQLIKAWTEENILQTISYYYSDCPTEKRTAFMKLTESMQTIADNTLKSELDAFKEQTLLKMKDEEIKRYQADAAKIRAEYESIVQKRKRDKDQFSISQKESKRLKTALQSISNTLQTHGIAMAELAPKEDPPELKPAEKPVHIKNFSIIRILSCDECNTEYVKVTVYAAYIDDLFNILFTLEKADGHQKRNSRSKECHFRPFSTRESRYFSPMYEYSAEQIGYFKKFVQKRDIPVNCIYTLDVLNTELDNRLINTIGFPFNQFISFIGESITDMYTRHIASVLDIQKGASLKDIVSRISEPGVNVNKDQLKSVPNLFEDIKSYTKSRRIDNHETIKKIIDTLNEDDDLL